MPVFGFARRLSKNDVDHIVREARIAGVLPGPEPNKVDVNHRPGCIGQHRPELCSCNPAPDIVVSYTGPSECKDCKYRRTCPSRH